MELLLVDTTKVVENVLYNVEIVVAIVLTVPTKVVDDAPINSAEEGVVDVVKRAYVLPKEIDNKIANSKAEEDEKVHEDVT